MPQTNKRRLLRKIGFCNSLLSMRGSVLAALHICLHFVFSLFFENVFLFAVFFPACLRLPVMTDFFVSVYAPQFLSDPLPAEVFFMVYSSAEIFESVYHSVPDSQIGNFLYWKLPDRAEPVFCKYPADDHQRCCGDE